MNKVDRSLHVPAVDPDAFYERVCKADSRPVPDVLRESHPFPGGQVTVPVERYTSREYHDLEVERLWKKCWQMACREEEIPEIGDTHVYEIASMKFIIVRTSPTKIKAYANSCLHRGRQLVDCDGRHSELRCPYHGFGWDLEGRLAKIPGAWDFEIDPETWRLPEAQVGTWGGFVFINPDPKAPALSAFLGDIDRHYARYPLQDRYIAGHAAKVVPTNWKAAQDAFMEAFHVQGTHPQLLPQAANTDYKYDCYDNYARAIGVNFIPSIWVAENPSEQQMMDAVMDVRLDEKPTVIVPDEKTARLQTADLARNALSQFIGDAADKMSDTEMVELLLHEYFSEYSSLGGLQPDHVPLPSLQGRSRSRHTGRLYPVAVQGRATAGREGALAERRRGLDPGTRDRRLSGTHYQSGSIQHAAWPGRNEILRKGILDVLALPGKQDSALSFADG